MVDGGEGWFPAKWFKGCVGFKSFVKKYKKVEERLGEICLYYSCEKITNLTNLKIGRAHV